MDLHLCGNLTDIQCCSTQSIVSVYKLPHTALYIASIWEVYGNKLNKVKIDAFAFDFLFFFSFNWFLELRHSLGIHGGVED